MAFKFSDNSEKNMKGVHPELIGVFRSALRVSPIDFGIPGDGGVRTAKRQGELYHADKSKCDGFIDRSNHQIQPGQEYGRALDFYAYVNGKASWEAHHLAMVAGVILGTANRLYKEGAISIQLRWGGTFGSDSFDGWDMPHMEII